MGVLASEEEDAPVGLDDDAEELYEWNKEVVVEEGQKCIAPRHAGRLFEPPSHSGTCSFTRYVAVFDPLDGSSNVDANIPTGAPSPTPPAERSAPEGLVPFHCGTARVTKTLI